MKFTKYNMDFEIPEAKLGNYFFANILMPYSLMLGFTFPDYLQSETFILQKMTYNEYVARTLCLVFGYHVWRNTRWEKEF